MEFQITVRRRAFSILLAILILGLSACTQSPDCFRPNVFCVGLVTNTAGIKDFGLNQSSWEGMQQALTQGIVEHVAYIETIDSRDYARNIAAFGESGYDVIITIGPALDDETLHAAGQYPDSVLIGMDQPQEESRPNLLSITFPEDQMGFWAGALAARITETGVVAGVCETSGIDSMWRYCQGFRNGATHEDRNVKTLILFRDNGISDKLFIDSEWGHTTAMDFIRRGADVVFAAGGGTGEGALLAAAEAGVHAIGTERDQARSLTEAQSAVVTSIYGRTDLEVLKWTRLIRDDQFSGGRVTGVFGYASYDENNPPVSSTIQKEMDDLLLALSAGTIATNVPSSAP